MHEQDSAIHTSRNLKSSLDIIRKKERSPIGIITNLEEKFKKELEARYGALLTQNDISGIVVKEELRNKSQKLAIDKARLKMLRLKEKIRMIQWARNEHNLFGQIKEHIDNDLREFQNVIFKKIDISY